MGETNEVEGNKIALVILLISDLNVAYMWIKQFNECVFLLLSVTEDHPEVQALVLTALEEAKHMSFSELDIYVEVLQKRLKEVNNREFQWGFETKTSF